jgi:hypothetical protein
MSSLTIVPQKLRSSFTAASEGARARLSKLGAELAKHPSWVWTGQLKGVWGRATLRVRGVLDLPSREALNALSARVEKLAKKLEAFEQKAQQRIAKRGRA